MELENKIAIELVKEFYDAIEKLIFMYQNLYQEYQWLMVVKNMARY